MTNNQQSNYINTFVVTTANDENDGVNNGTGLSLREAVSAANSSAGADRIVFDRSLDGSNISLNLGEIAITDALAIKGLGAEALTIDANNSSRIFNVDDGDAEQAIAVSIANLTIANGMTTESGGAISNQEDLVIKNSVVTGSTAAVRGGGIYSEGSLLLQNSTVSDNRAEERTGGGVVNGGYLQIDNSTIANNYATYGGGGVSNDGTAIISNSLIEVNSADFDGGGVLNLDTLEIVNTKIANNSTANSGGGLANGSEGSVSIASSTISGNMAGFAGGGIYNVEAEDIIAIQNSTIANNQAQYGGGISNSGTATISSSTISGNNAEISGGGIDNYEGSVEVKNSTISNNSAEAGAGLNNTYGIEFSVTSTIVAGNTGDLDLSGDEFISGGNNLIGNGDDAAGFVTGENGDLVGDTDNPLDPKLGALQDNGGATETQALLQDSPALDAGSNPDNLSFDQRGKSFTRTNGAIDIGAFENQSLSLEGTNKADVLSGASGDDTIAGLNGKDFLKGNAGNDLLDGGKGRDILLGGAGNDLFDGGKGKDIIFGGSGNDTLFGGAGTDLLLGGSGSDVFVLETLSGQDTIFDFQDGTDLFALGSNLSFNDLNITDTFGGVMIKNATDNSAIAFVSRVDATDITQADFTAL